MTKCEKCGGPRAIEVQYVGDQKRTLCAECDKKVGQTFVQQREIVSGSSVGKTYDHKAEEEKAAWRSIQRAAVQRTYEKHERGNGARRAGPQESPVRKKRGTSVRKP